MTHEPATPDSTTARPGTLGRKALLITLTGTAVAFASALAGSFNLGTCSDIFGRTTSCSAGESLLVWLITISLFLSLPVILAGAVTGIVAVFANRGRKPGLWAVGIPVVLALFVSRSF